MQYAYESWISINPEQRSDEAHFPLPLGEDLKELESTLGMGLEEAMATPPQVKSALDVERHLHVLLTQMQYPLQAQVDKMWKIADAHYQDNKALAQQIQQLLQEREQLLSTLHAYEMERNRYQQLFGNIYLKH